MENGLLHVGGFRCASLKPLGNDPSLDLYRTGYWNYTGFRMEVWRRLGIPFWYRKGTGVVRVAGEGWRPELGNDISSAEAGGKASADGRSRQRRKNLGSIPMLRKSMELANAIDQDKSTSWQPSDERHRGKLTVTFAALARVESDSLLVRQRSSFHAS